jgi:hypothetical protein
MQTVANVSAAMKPWNFLDDLSSANLGANGAASGARRLFMTLRAKSAQRSCLSANSPRLMSYHEDKERDGLECQTSNHNVVANAGITVLM